MKTKLSTLAICFCVLAIAAGPVLAEPKVEVTGLSIAKASDGKSGRSKAGIISAGTSVYLEIADSSQTFIKIDAKASKLDSFTDGKGTDLTATTKKKRWGKPRWLGSFPKIADDKHTVRFQIKSSTCPARGATKLKITATIALLAGSEPKSEKQENVELKLDSKITIGPAPFEVKKIEKGWGKWKIAVTLSTDKPVDGIKSLKFFDADGKEIESKKTSWGTSGKSANLTYSLKKKVEKATVEITYFQKVKKITVPINVTAGVGL